MKLFKKNPFSGSDGNRAPLMSGAVPGLGHMLAFRKTPIELLTQGWQEHGSTFRMQLLNQQVMVLIGPKASEACFRAPDAQLSPHDIYKFMTPIFGHGIAYDTTPEIMSEQLGFLLPALRDARMRTYAQMMAQETERYLDGWGEEGEIDFVDAMTELTTFISSRCLLGQEFRENLTGEFAHLYHTMESGINQVAMFYPYIPLPSMIARDRARFRMSKLITELVHSRRASGVKGEDFLQTLIDARYKDDRVLTDEEVTGLLLTTLFAGHHTSAVLSTWMGILMLQNPHCMPPILDELQEVYGDGEEITFESLKKLQRMESTVHEAARMAPPLVMLMRKAMTDFEYGGYTARAGDMVMVSPAVSQRDPDVFPNPHIFDPERHLPPREEHKKPYGIITFGGGKHRCMGTHFAFMQIKALFSVLLRRYELELVESSYVPDYSGFVVGPKRPARVRYRRVERRKTSSDGFRRRPSLDDAARPIALA